jgi:cytochrome c oxidase assembly factor CtaG
MPSTWSFDFAWPELLAIGILSGAYALEQRRRPASRARVLCFVWAMALLVAVSVTPLGTLAKHYLLVAHLFQNVVLAEWAPALAVLGLSPATAAALGRRQPVYALTHPLVALPLWLVTYAVWHVPALYDAALEQPPLLFLEHACYFAAGVVFWWPALRSEPRDLNAGVRAAYVFAAFVLASPLGLLFALLPNPLYDFYVEAPRVGGLDPLEDQQLAGILMAGSELVVFFAVFAFYFARFLAEEE